jgi:sugar/nucleoside kinase (ribokinase family)
LTSVDLVVVGNLLLDDLPHGLDIPGGAALFTALAARCCGLSVAVHSVVGHDYPVHWLEEAGVLLSLRRLDGPGGRTVIRYTPQGRTLRHQGPCHRTLSPQEPHPFRCRLVHIAPMPTDIQAFHLQACPPRGALLDPYPHLDEATWRLFSPCRDKMAGLLLNEEELHLELAALGGDVWTILKQAERGGMSLHPNLGWQAIPAEVVDLTGAGDAFAAGLAAGIIRGDSAESSLRAGALAASWALGGIGADALYRRATSKAEIRRATDASPLP